MTGAFHINPHEPKVLVKQTGRFKTETGDWQDRESVETEAISVAMRDYLPAGGRIEIEEWQNTWFQVKLRTIPYHIDLADKENTLDGLPMPIATKQKTMPSTWLDSKIPVWARGNIPTNKEIELLQLKEVYIQKNKGPMVGNRRDNAKIGLAAESNLALGMDCKGESVRPAEHQ